MPCPHPTPLLGLYHWHLCVWTCSYRCSAFMGDGAMMKAGATSGCLLLNSSSLHSLSQFLTDFLAVSSNRQVPQAAMRLLDNLGSTADLCIGHLETLRHSSTSSCRYRRRTSRRNAVAACTENYCRACKRCTSYARRTASTLCRFRVSGDDVTSVDTHAVDL